MHASTSPFRKVVTVTRDVHLPPQFFDQDIYHHLTSVIVQQFTNKCDEELGVLLDVEKVRGMTNKISKNSMYAEFTVTFDAVVSKPVEEVPFEFKIEQVQTTGIFGMMDNMLKIFVPTSYLKKWAFVENDQNAEHNAYVQGDIVLMAGTTVPARIKLIKFLADKFGCICELLVGEQEDPVAKEFDNDHDENVV